MTKVVTNCQKYVKQEIKDKRKSITKRNFYISCQMQIRNVQKLNRTTVMANTSDIVK